MAAETPGKHAMPTPVPAGDAGSPSGSVRWARRVVSAALVIGAAAIVLILFSQVLLSPGKADPQSGNTVQNPTESSDPSPSTAPTTPSPTSAPTSAVTPPAETKAPEPSTATRPSPTATTDEPRETRPSKPGNPPTAPPGKPK